MSFGMDFDPLDDALDFFIFEDVTKEKDSDDWDDDFDDGEDD